MGRAGEDPGHAGEHHEGQEEVGAVGAAGPGLGEAPQPVFGDAAAVGVILQRGEENQRLLIRSRQWGCQGSLPAVRGRAGVWVLSVNN